MAPPRFTTSTEEQGINCGNAFSDGVAPTDLENLSIARIVVTHNTLLISLTVYYAGSARLGGVRHGGSGGTEDNIVLAQGEIITSIEGSVLTFDGISTLKFVTNKRTYGPFGTLAGQPFGWHASSYGTKNMEFLYFTGRADKYMIRALRGNFGEICTSDPPSILKFENIPVTTSSEQSASLSRFARNLVSPQVILSIGPNNIEFHVSRDMLCRLPYFRAALTGGFREAVDNRIVMPEDSPDTMAALIEFLYHGVYTYTYASATTSDTPPSDDIPPSNDPPPSDDTPPSDVAQGEFHVAVYVVADRYDCRPLAEAAVRHFMNVLEQLGELDSLKLWKAAYANDLPISKWGLNDAKNHFVAGLAGQLNVLYRDHEEEVEEVFKQYPILATDVLRLVVTWASMDP